MGGINLNKKLWRMPQKGMVRGVCAGIADYLDVPVNWCVFWSCCRFSLGWRFLP